MKQPDTYSPPLHLQRQQLLLRMEYDYEKAEYQRQMETMGVERKVKRGLCWWPVSVGRNYYNSLNQLVLEVTRTEDLDLEHAFEFGKPVAFNHQYNIPHPDLDSVDQAKQLAGGLMPFYNTTEKMKRAFLNSRAIQNLQYALLSGINWTLPETLPARFSYTAVSSVQSMGIA